MGSNPCIIGVASHTWRGNDAPEPLDMWETVIRRAAADAGREQPVLDAIDTLDVVFCQTWQYDDPPRRLADRLGIEIGEQRRRYSGIGGTTPQQFVNAQAAAILRGELEVAVVVSAEALATQKFSRSAGTRVAYSFKPPEKRPFPWDTPFHPSELAHEVFQAWLTFAVFDSARRAHLGYSLDDYRHELAEMMSGLTAVAERNPDAWFRTRRTASDIETVRDDNRMIGYPYTKYMVAIMDVDMAAAVVVASEEAADRLGVPRDRRVYLRGWCSANDPVHVAEHANMWRSPAMAAASSEALRVAEASVDDVGYLDLYSCFGASLNFAVDALGLDRSDPRPLTVTGGLPYHGGPGSGYLTHSIAEMARTLRADPGAVGMVSGVGMAMTKHVYALYSTTPPRALRLPDEALIQSRVDHDCPNRLIVSEHEGSATVVAYSIVHDRSGAPESGLFVVEIDGGSRGYARSGDRALLDEAERHELIGTRVRLTPETVRGATGEVRRNRAMA